MRRTIRTIGWIGLAGVVVAAVASAVVIVRVRATHPRNEATYLQYIHRYIRGSSLHAFDSHVAPGAVSDQQLIDAGDRACDWLSRQPPALFITAYRFRLTHLTDRYWKATLDSDWAMPRQVYGAAWAHLCPATRYLVRPHNVLSAPGSDPEPKD